MLDTSTLLRELRGLRDGAKAEKLLLVRHHFSLHEVEHLIALLEDDEAHQQLGKHAVKELSSFIASKGNPTLLATWKRVRAVLRLQR